MKNLIYLTLPFLLTLPHTHAGLPLSADFDMADSIVCGSLGEPTGITKELTVKSTAKREQRIEWIEYRLSVDTVVNFQRTIVLPDGTSYPKHARRNYLRDRLKIDRDGEYINVLIYKGTAPKKNERSLWFLNWQYDLGSYSAYVARGADGAHQRILKAYPPKGKKAGQAQGK